MIRLKEKVNKTQIMKELREELTKQLEGTYEVEYTTTLCMIGAEKLFEKLRLPQVMPSFKNAPWCKMNSKCETKLCKRKNGMCSADSRHF